MPIKEDLSGLPSDDDRPGCPPVKHPILVNKLAEAWYEDHLAGDDHTPSATWWASLSGMCARSVGYNIVEGRAKRELREAMTAAMMSTVSEKEKADNDARAVDIGVKVAALSATNPPSVADLWRMGLGSMVHTQLQTVLTKAFPGAEVEVRVEIEDFGSGRIDVVLTEDRDGTPYITVLELKTINGFGYKASAINFKGPADGPRKSAIMQGAVTAKQLDADLLVIGYLSLECLSPDVATRNGMDEIGRFAAEWHYTRDEYLPIADAELRRVRKIIELVDKNELPPRHTPEIPVGARITDPSSGAWSLLNDEGGIIQAGKTWVCGYCWNRDRCLSDGPS